MSLDTLRRVFIVVIDALGVGALPDAPEYQDSLSVNTLGSIDRVVSSLHLPNLQKLGIGNVTPLQYVSINENPIGSYGKMAERSKGKDTTTGHWEMMGIYLETPFPTYPEGFPPEIITEFVQKTGCQDILGNIPASGTEILTQLGPRHLETGYPIVYTSADSVFQIAAHMDKVSLETLYQWCETAREILQGQHRVSRVIARPFKGAPGQFERIGKDRRDYAVPPISKTVLDQIKAESALVVGIGKIEDIFCHVGITHSCHTGSNTEGLNIIQDLISHKVPLNDLSVEGKPVCDYVQPNRQLMFINLVDTDMKYGHRRDAQGYAYALEEFDRALGGYLETLQEGDLLIITGDHGCDPTAPGSDHTREYVPILMYNKVLAGQDLGTRTSFADIGQTTLDWLGFSSNELPGLSCLSN